MYVLGIENFGVLCENIFHNAVFVYTFSVFDMVMRPYPGAVHMNVLYHTRPVK